MADVSPPAPGSDWLLAPLLHGPDVTLRPLTEADAPALSAGADEATVAFLGQGSPQPRDLGAWAAHVHALNTRPNRVNWAVCLNGPEGPVVGRISYSEAKPADRWVELGTMLLPTAQGTGVNAQAKWLLMTRAFDVLGAGRVQFKVDARNARSLRAMEKLGAVREGVLRQYQVRPDGLARDSVMFSVLREEWPQVAARLLTRQA